LIPLEREGFWLLKIIPNSIRLALKGKLLLSLIVNFIFALVITLGFFIYFQPGLASGLQFFLLAVSLSLGSSGIGLFIGCLFPRFDWEHPKRMLTPAGSIWLMISSIFWYVIVFILFAIAKVITGSFINFSLLFLIVLSIIILSMNLIIIKYSVLKIEKTELT